MFLSGFSAVDPRICESMAWPFICCDVKLPPDGTYPLVALVIYHALYNPGYLSLSQVAKGPKTSLTNSFMLFVISAPETLPPDGSTISLFIFLCPLPISCLVMIFEFRTDFRSDGRITDELETLPLGDTTSDPPNETPSPLPSGYS